MIGKSSKPPFRPLVYICAPYSGDVDENKEKAAAFAAYAYGKGNIPLTPHLLFPFMDDAKEEERETAMFMDIVLMGKCQEVWVLGEIISPGMKTEITRAKQRRQTVRYFDSNFEEQVGRREV